MNSLEQIFPKARAELLRLLFADSGQSLHLRDLARLSHLAVGTIQREIANMREAGLVLEKRDGNRLYFRANPEHPLYPELHSIALKTTGWLAQLTEALRPVEGIDLAFVYGSFASDTATAQSDIDLLVIGSVGLRQLAPRLRPLSATLGREINPNAISPQSYAEKLRARDAYITDVTTKPKRWIIGSDDELAKLA
ncbi:MULTISPECIES: nucleotidyltransferase domain-containing protein [Ruficoccus]|uniref:Nucleotidyltransferase domain-containing protein n=1 Tax=Ruficoccus amylovorans TaxID=1804625 RepID=A0A842HDV8_9BACT|nr:MULTISPECIES: nucleotidyltransferase domain-containing protein [Ruficoccus]MBC2594622.1 nucleotidyltransferase domain-containing protein [Ruficoccus amylovorans]QYY36727.1 nucleotidyltransferase domain-containing protein [Ruficoccus sp. ZRK36]